MLKALAGSHGDAAPATVSFDGVHCADARCDVVRRGARTGRTEAGELAVRSPLAVHACTTITFSMPTSGMRMAATTRQADRDFRHASSRRTLGRHRGGVGSGTSHDALRRRRRVVGVERQARASHAGWACVTVGKSEGAALREGGPEAPRSPSRKRGGRPDGWQVAYNGRSHGTATARARRDVPEF